MGSDAGGIGGSVTLVGGAAIALLLSIALVGWSSNSSGAASTSSSSSPQPDYGCENRHDDRQCDQFAARGECNVAPGWMYVMCAKSCGDCTMLDPKVRCNATKMGMSTDPAMRPGDLNAMFERWIEDPAYEKYSPEVLMRPPKGP